MNIYVSTVDKLTLIFDVAERKCNSFNCTTKQNIHIKNVYLWNGSVVYGTNYGTMKGWNDAIHHKMNLGFYFKIEVKIFCYWISIFLYGVWSFWCGLVTINGVCWLWWKLAIFMYLIYVRRIFVYMSTEQCSRHRAVNNGHMYRSLSVWFLRMLSLTLILLCCDFANKTSHYCVHT